MIETRLLHYFLAIAREQNITRAAETLHVTQSTLSKQMMDLENQLGKQLFIRGKRKITLTEEGNFLRNRGQEILELMNSTESAFHTDGRMITGDINIACGETSAMDFITEIYRRLHETYPDVKLHIHSGDADTVTERLDKGLADIGLLIGSVKREKYDYINIRQKDVFGLLMPNDCELADQEVIQLEQLKNLPLILSEQTFSGHQEINWFGIDYRKLNIAATYNLIYNATFLVEKGIGYALCLDRLVNTANRNFTFRPVIPELSVELYLVTKKYQVFSPAVRAFLKEVQISLLGDETIKRT